jgi:membrane-bound metal-dependent hydrolase YbcI (DUF457 family)
MLWRQAAPSGSGTTYGKLFSGGNKHVFLGHFALAFAAKKADAEVSLGTYFLAAQLPDMLWPGFVLAGVEHVSIAPGDTAFTPLRFDSYPFSHSLLAVAFWASLMAGLHYLSKRRARAAALIGMLVLSHWILDCVSHRPDMPLFPGPSPRLGLGLWNSVPATLAVESVLFLGGVALCLTATRARDRVGSYGLAALVGFLGIVYVANVVGSPPPSAEAAAFVCLFGVGLIIAAAAWVDRHRVAIAG